jgi:RNA 2',3'-cyclic 3'-phosphodiesterase
VSRGVRAFIALELSPPVRSAIAGLMADLRDRFAGLRWVRPESVHLTLRFLGESTPGQIERLRDTLGPLAARCKRAEAVYRGLGLFPERGRPSVLWLGVELPEPLVALQAGCEAAAVAAGFPAESRPFRPHLTLGRWRDRAARPDLPAVDLGSTLLDTLVLFRSELRPEGALYTELQRFDLGG